MAEKEPPKTLNLRHKDAPGMAYVFADGAFVRPTPGHLIITYYTEDVDVVGEAAELAEIEGSTGTFQVTGMTEEFVRRHHAVVRMCPEASLRLARLIVEKVNEVRPDVVEKSGIQTEKK